MYVCVKVVQKVPSLSQKEETFIAEHFCCGNTLVLQVIKKD